MGPLVTVVISTHNRSTLLSRAIESVISQTYENIQIVVSDDASTDDTELLVNHYIEQYPHVDIIYRSNSVNSGACVTRNEGIKIAKGEFITGLDDDDTFERNRIQEFVKLYNKNYSFLCSNINVITKKGSYKLFGNDDVDISLDDALWYNCIGNQIFVKKEFILGVGGFDNSLTSAQDIDLWIRILSKYGSGCMLASTTYNLHVDHDEPRITTSSKKLDGLKKYIERNRNLMSSSQLKFHTLRFLYWENNCRFKFSLIKNIDFKVLLFMFSLFINQVRKRIYESCR